MGHEAHEALGLSAWFCARVKKLSMILQFSLSAEEEERKPFYGASLVLASAGDSKSKRPAQRNAGGYPHIPAPRRS